MWTTVLTILYTLLVVGVVVVILTGGDDIYRMFSWLMVVLFSALRSLDGFDEADT